MKYLIDTNLFLEIFLEQDKKEDCIRFLDNNFGEFGITDFTLHSIGVILFKFGKEDLFLKFTKDLLNRTKILSLPTDQYSELIKVRKNMNLDFDDTYQYSVAKNYGLEIVTMDKDFSVVKDLEILFL
ncbi:PIN domain-containing protein [bacterium]|nr:PIN domain-containing protein [bacterium]